jgi:hypothetical protein
MNPYKKGDKFEVLKKGVDTGGAKVKKGSIVLMYDMSLGCNPPPHNGFYLKIKGVTTGGQIIEWPLDHTWLKKVKAE